MMKQFPRVVIAIIVLVAVTFSGCSSGVLFGYFLEEQELTAEELYEKVSPSVVEVTGKSAYASSTGTGFFYDNKGTVITNYHVIDGCTTASITLSNGKTYNVVEVLGYSESQDIAILSTNCDTSIPLEIRETAVKTGENVYAIGSSLGLSGSLSNGIISSAEREVDGQTFIQTTAPISRGNSGGPLLDSKGRVVGITTASFTDGQNLNLAIPVKEAERISTKNPITLAEMFRQTVQWISERDFFFYDECDKFVLVFELADEYEIAMCSSGTVDIRIVNNEGVTVYNKTRTFDENSFEEWTYNQTIKKYLATIYIDPSEIAGGTSSEGTVYFTVYGEDYYFNESTLTAYDLPTKPIEVKTEQLPLKVNSYSYDGSIYTTTRVDNITYEIMYDDCLYIYFSGEKVYDYDGNYATNSCEFCWKLYDSDGYLLDSGTIFVFGLSVGDKFKGEEGYAFDCIEPGGTYKIVITDYS